MSTTAEAPRVELYSHESELGVLASMIVFPNMVGEVREIVTEDDFSPPNAIVFQAIIAACEGGAVPDVHVLLRFLDGKPESFGIEAANWAHFLGKLITEHTGCNGVYHAKIVRDLARKRKVYSTVGGMFAALQDRAPSPLESINEVEMLWRESGIAEFTGGDDELPTISEAAAMIRRHLDGEEDMHRCLPTGLVDLDDALNGGIHAGSLTVVAAQSGFGKTALGTRIARGAAEFGTVLYVSVEMSRAEILERMIASEEDVLYTLVRRGILSPTGRESAEKALKTLEKLSIRMPSQKAPTVEEIASWARRLHGTEGLSLIVVDYVQILRTSKGQEKFNREQQVNHFALTLKQLAAELQIPVLTMSQLNDQGEMRDSRAIEHHADFVLVIEGADQKGNADGLTEVGIKIKKGRSVEKCTVSVLWEGRFVRFKSDRESNELPLESASF